MSEGRWVLFLLGGDLEDPRWFVDRATQRLGEAFGQTPRASRDHWTEPWGFQDHRLFLNRAVLIRTNNTPDGIMATALAIERELGRVRAGADRYAPRTIDIDVLMVEGLVLRSEHIDLPHPRMHERAFALAPAADLCPDQLHPVLGLTVLQLLNELQGRT
ncbi:MAG: 2-amino-4-hydroxy-6-hydroxymethyldihydropteridine diphosphokinase [Flavobacteriales bacterium]|jgi:2-amino-4-hydroxy-6-hydroxymethyldihydropteridine diphosphokinase|nr:2-amino-4-hydroxy-6-hydroxymethyldihydropteridine diphosphokinase [Flavobacteriales bacterium]